MHELIAARLASPRVNATEAITIGPGSADDYRALERFHYRAGEPRVIDLVLAARDERAGPEPVGVLVVARPTLNGAWRAAAFGGAYSDPDMRARAHAVNTHLRTIARVVVDPRYRSIGLATRLVRAYLDRPLTRHTEALAAMGRYSPFFVRAGMTEHAAPESHRDRLLRARLRRRGLGPVALASLPMSRMRRVEGDLRAWAASSRSTYPIRREPIEVIARAAVSALLAPPIAYAHDATPGF